MEPTAASPQGQVEQPFSLGPAIFTPFLGISKEPSPIEPKEKLERILENLDKQHDAVKKNMMYLIEKRAEAMVNTAKEDLALCRGNEGRREGMKQRSREMRETIQRTKVTMQADAKGEAYEVGENTFQDESLSLFVEEDPDVEMGGTDAAAPKPRTAAAIRREVTHELRGLIMRGGSEMEAYDSHAEETKKQYRQALERRKGRNPSTSTGSSSTLPTKGILKTG